MILTRIAGLVLAIMAKRKAKSQNSSGAEGSTSKAPDRLHSAATLYRGASYLEKMGVKSETQSVAERLKDLAHVCFHAEHVP